MDLVTSHRLRTADAITILAPARPAGPATSPSSSTHRARLPGQCGRSGRRRSGMASAWGHGPLPDGRALTGAGPLPAALQARGHPLERGAFAGSAGHETDLALPSATAVFAAGARSRDPPRQLHRPASRLLLPAFLFSSLLRLQLKWTSMEAPLRLSACHISCSDGALAASERHLIVADLLGGPGAAARPRRARHGSSRVLDPSQVAAQRHATSPTRPPPADHLPFGMLGHRDDERQAEHAPPASRAGVRRDAAA